jgi:hypothetical protein
MLFFFKFEYYIFYVSYPFVAYLLTLRRPQHVTLFLFYFILFYFYIYTIYAEATRSQV